LLATERARRKPEWLRAVLCAPSWAGPMEARWAGRVSWCGAMGTLVLWGLSVLVGFGGREGEWSLHDYDYYAAIADAASFGLLVVLFDWFACVR
jgi:hypothetical protein